MVDRDLFLRTLADLDLYLPQVSEYRTIEAEDYRRDRKTQRIVECTLQMAIEACVHEGARVDPEIVVRILRQHLDDLARFGATARGWV